MPLPQAVLQAAESEALAQELNPILVVAGPTASGKTDLALALAARLGGEVVSADMGQLYRGLDAGTAKPRGVRRGGVTLADGIPYHLLDELDIPEPSDAGGYARKAAPVLDDILRRGRRAIVAGGTGLYLRALLEGLDPLPQRDLALRARLEKRSREELHAELVRRDPESARRIPPGNRQRVVRALEVCELAGRPFSELCRRGSRPPRYERVLTLGIERTPEELSRRIRERAEAMFPAMLEEVSRLVPSRFSGAEPGFRCLGYPEALACLRGELSAQQGLEGMIRSTLAYAKRQRTWFRHQAQVRWLDPAVDPARLAAELA